MKAPEVKPKVQLTGHDGSSMAIIGKTQTALRRAGADAEYIAKFYSEATSGDYNHVIQTAMKYTEVS